jgi:hypothetical protein
MICPWADNGALTGFLERQQDKLSSLDKFSLVGSIFKYFKALVELVKYQLNDIALGLQYRKLPRAAS